MYKFKRFLKMHYKKFVTVSVVFVLMVTLLFSQVFATQYTYKMLDVYRSSVVDFYYNYYVGTDNSNLQLEYIIPTRETYNNRFTALFNSGISDNPSLRKNVHRFDLTLRFNNEFEVYKGDNLSFYFWLSSQCYFYDLASQGSPNYRLHYFRVWFNDDTNLVNYPSIHWFKSDGTVNDQEFRINFGTMTQNKGKIVSINFSFILDYGANASNLPWGNQQPWVNVWFGDSLTTYVDRDTAQNPIYKPPNDNGIINDHNKVEDDIENGIENGLEDSKDMFTDFSDTFLSNESRIYKGLLFVTNCLNMLFHIEIFTTLGHFALSLGLFAFLVGIVQLVKSSVERSNNKNNKGGGS